jgi:mannosyltransferase OCH1-like enzyme
MPILIPRIIHYVWLGNKPMHPLMIQWRKDWQKLHPGWEIKVWAEGPIIGELVDGSHVLKSHFPHMLERCCHLSQRSNIWRYELIEQLGGLYLDPDFEPVKCIEPIIKDMPAFAGQALTSYTEAGTRRTKIEVGCSLIGSVPHHPWAQDLRDSLENRDSSVSRSLGFGYFTEITSRHPEVHLFEPDTFYSTKYDDQGRYKPAIPSSSYAVHRWSSNWFPNGFKPIRQP